MKQLRTLLAASLGLLLCGLVANDASAARQPTNPAGFKIQRGTNLSHWLSQDFGWAPRDTWITEADMRFIAAKGFDHVRLPIDEKELWDEAGKPIEKEFTRLLTAIDWARKAGLRVIVDLHTVRSHHFNAVHEGMAANTLWSDPASQARFLSLWQDLSARLRQLPVSEVAYEILNEAVADDHEDWNALVAKTIAQLRRDEPSRVLVVGANRWQIPSNMPFLKVPANDRNIILSFHTYSPMLFTHHKADWVPIKTYTKPVRYPGPLVDKATHAALLANPEKTFTDLVLDAADNWGPARMLEGFKPAIDHAAKLGLQLYCGEFGVMPTVDRQSRLAYYRDITGVFEAQGIAWANWEYKGDFGLYHWKGLPELCGDPDTELLEAMLGHAKAGPAK